MSPTQIVFTVPYSVASAWDRTPGMIQDRIEAAVLEVIQRELGIERVTQNIEQENLEYVRP